LADRPINFRPKNAIGYKRLLPLSEIIKAVLGVTYPGAQRVWSIYKPLIQKFGDEYKVLMEIAREDLVQIVDLKIADAIIRVREERAQVLPGHDGVYGELRIFEEEKVTKHDKPIQKSMSEFM
jgi:PHP family Zn ribbon phosphoesterase